MTLSKRQVKALLDVISKDESRPILTYAKLDIYKGKPVLVATDSYHMVVLPLTDTILPEATEGKLISRDDLTKWYKLAENRELLGDLELATMAQDEAEVGKYPAYAKLIEGFTPQAVSFISFNPDYIANMQTLAGIGRSGLKWQFHGVLGAMLAELDGAMYIVMPMKG